MGVENPYDDSVIKGAGWTTETLKAIKEFVDTLETSLGAFTAAENLKAILGAYTSAAPLKTAIDALALIATVARGLLIDRLSILNVAGGAGELTAARAGYLEELAAANIPTDLANIIAYVDLIDDAASGLAAIKAEVEGLGGAAMRGTDNAMLAANGALEATLTTMKGVGWATETLHAIYDLIALIPTTAMRGTDSAMLAANGATAAELLKVPKSDSNVSWNATALAAIQAQAAAALAAAANKKQAGVTQIFQKVVQQATDLGAYTLATITTQPCLIKDIVVKAVTAVQDDLTSAAVTGGTAGAVIFLSATDAAKANITAIDQQVSWSGAVEFAVAKTIVMTLVGVGDFTPCNLLVTIRFKAVLDGGYLV